MQNLPRRGQDSSEPRPSCIKMSCHWKPVTSAFVVYPFLAKYPSSFCATESACHCPELETVQKLPPVLQLQQLPYSKKIFCVYHVVGTVGVCACMDSAQTYAAGIHLRIRLSTLPIRILEISSLSYLLQSLSILYLYGPMGIV